MCRLSEAVDEGERHGVDELGEISCQIDLKSLEGRAEAEDDAAGNALDEAGEAGGSGVVGVDPDEVGEWSRPRSDSAVRPAVVASMPQ